MQNDKTGRGIAINDMVFNVQSEVIRQLAEKESVTRIEDGRMNRRMETELVSEVISEALRHIS